MIAADTPGPQLKVPTQARLTRNDAHASFEALRDQVITVSARTNEQPLYAIPIVTP